MSWGDRREARLDGSERGATRPKKRAARVGADDRTLECERAGTSMLFGNLGAPAKARPEVPEVPSSESSKGHPQSRERSVTRTTCMGESGQQERSTTTRKLPPRSGRWIKFDDRNDLRTGWQHSHCSSRVDPKLLRLRRQRPKDLAT